MSRTTKEQRAILAKVGSSDVQDLVQDLNEVEQRLDDALRALSETTEGFDAPHRIEKADDHGGIYVWSDGHQHAYHPTSALEGERERREAAEQKASEDNDEWCLIAEEMDDLRAQLASRDATIARLETSLAIYDRMPADTLEAYRCVVVLRRALEHYAKPGVAFDNVVALAALAETETP